MFPTKNALRLREGERTASEESPPRRAILIAFVVGAILVAGCQSLQGPSTCSQDLCCTVAEPKPWIPRELNKATVPTYRVEPPDMLTIDVVPQVLQSSYLLHVGDTVVLSVAGAFPDEPIAGEYRVGVGGLIDLGYSYGAIEVAGLTIEAATQLIEKHLRNQVKDPRVAMSLHNVANSQRLSGEFMVYSDGTVTLGPFGSVSVVGLTLDEIRMKIAHHLSAAFANPQVSVSVCAFNSKAYYIVMQGGGTGDKLIRLPCKGNETVMDALSEVNGLSCVSSTRMWIARPDRDCGSSQILPVDWKAITQRADVETNYQVLPGDRLYIAHDRLIAFDTALAKALRPFERIFSFTILGTGAVSRLSGKVLDNELSILAPIY